MKNISERLWNLQTKLSQTGRDSDTEDVSVRALRDDIGPTLLSRFDQIWQRGRKAVAIVRHGVCSECHIQLPKARLIALAIEDRAHLCSNCGRYLYLSADESTKLLQPPAKAKPVAASRKKSLTHVR